MSHDCHKAVGVGCHMIVTKLLGLDVTWLSQSCWGWMSHDCHKDVGVGCHMIVTKLLGLDVT